MPSVPLATVVEDDVAAALRDIYAILRRINTNDLAAQMSTTTWQLRSIDRNLEPLRKLAEGTTAAMTLAAETARLQWLTQIRAESVGCTQWEAYQDIQAEAGKETACFIGGFVTAVVVLGALYFVCKQEK